MALTQSAHTVADVQRGLISRRIFLDEEIYQQELEQVFAKCWLFLGHESMIPSPGDYMTNYMGEDPILLIRDAKGKIHAFLNSCRHRGMKVCRSDYGNAQAFTCSYHGWTYANDGKLLGVPFFKEAYYDELDKEKWGLYEVPRLASYGGLIFGCWDEETASLEEYLGDLRWYLDIMLERPLGGLEVLPGRQKYVIAGNWKIPADNFAGDNYHVPYTHGSTFKLQARASALVRIPNEAQATITFKYGHGLGGVAFEKERYLGDLEQAQRLGGGEVKDYVEEQYQRLLKLSERQAKIFTLGHGNIFPNFSFNDFSCLRQFGFYLWHPKGPQKMEVWQWCAVDKAAPKVLKDASRIDFSRGQSATGFFGQDDSENFEQVTLATRGAVGRRLDFIYTMGLGHEEDYYKEGYPGMVGPQISEHCQRNFYASWAKWMDGEAPR